MDNTTAKEIWREVLPLLEKEVSILSYDVWIKTLEPAAIRDGTLVLTAASESGREFVISRFLALICRAVGEVNNLLTDVEIRTKEQLQEVPEPAAEPKPEPPKTAEFMSVLPKYNFENFVVGESNKLAHAAARAVADEPGMRYNPLFIFGGAGLGKTHLMHAVGNYIKLTKPSLKILFVSSEKFVNDLVTFIGIGNKGFAFREKYRSADVLMVDDIQFIAGKTATTEELFHTFNELYGQNKQLIFTSDRFPKDIPDIDERLRSRFEWGFTVNIQPPDLETRIAILRKKALIQKYNMPPEVLEYMAGCIDSNVREMEGLLNKVLMLSQLEDTPPNIELVKEAMCDYASAPKDAITPEDIISATCKLFNVTREELVGKKKNREIAEPRQLCVYCIYAMLDMPLEAIGKIFGGRDHTTILYARDKITERLGQGGKTAADVENIKNMVLKK